MTISASSQLRFAHGLWLGDVPSRYGPMEFVLAGTPDAPRSEHIAAIQAFMPHAGESIERLRRRLPLAFLWRPIRIAPNDQNRVGVQFQHRISRRLEILFDTDDGA